LTGKSFFKLKQILNPERKKKSNTASIFKSETVMKTVSIQAGNLPANKCGNLVNTW
jgi:hypothetical protein